MLNQVSISLEFYKQFFHTKVTQAVFGTYIVDLFFFWYKDIGVRAALKMLVKLTTASVNPNYKLCETAHSRTRL